MRAELRNVDLESSDTEKSSSLPYTNACVFEGQRLGVSSMIMHKSLCDTSVCGFAVAKDTPLLVTFYGALRDERVFDKPNEYIPERWINEDGKYEPNTSLVLPFGGGPRICPGKQLATIVIFTFVTRLIKNYVLSEVPGQENTLDSKFGLSRNPTDFRIKLSKI